MKNKTWNTWLSLPLFLCTALFVSGCPDGAAEDGGEAIDDAVEEAGDSLEDAAEAVDDAFDG